MASGDPQFQFLNTSNEFLTLWVSIKFQKNWNKAWNPSRYNIIVAGPALPQFPVSDLIWFTKDRDPNYQLQLEWLSDIEQLSKHCESVYGSLQALEDAI